MSRESNQSPTRRQADAIRVILQARVKKRRHIEIIYNGLASKLKIDLLKIKCSAFRINISKDTYSFDMPSGTLN